MVLFVLIDVDEFEDQLDSSITPLLLLPMNHWLINMERPIKQNTQGMHLVCSEQKPIGM